MGFIKALGAWTACLCVAGTMAADVCTEAELREAITAGGTVTFGCDTQIVLTAPLQITTNLVLDGNGRTVTISGGAAVRVFEVAEGVEFTARNLAVADGYFAGNNIYREEGTGNIVPGSDGFGGALAATNAILRMESCIFSNNVAKGGDGFGSGFLSGAAGKAYGGAIFAVDSEVDLVGSQFIANRAHPGLGMDIATDFASDSAGGAVYARGGTLKIVEGSFLENKVITAGGAIAVEDTAIEVEGSIFEGNVVSARTAGRFTGVSMGEGRGGALWLTNSTLLVTDSVFAENQITGGGGHFSGGGKLLGGAIFTEGNLEITGSSFLANSMTGAGLPHPPTNSAGGAIWVGGDARVERTRFVRNAAIGADAHANAASNDHGPAGEGFGGAAFVGGMLTLSESSFISNRVTGGKVLPPIEIFSEEAGRAFGSAVYASNAFFTNVTIAFNVVEGWSPAELGGAVYLGRTNLVRGSNCFHFCTIATNELRTIVFAGTLATNSTPSQVKLNTNVVASFLGTILSGGASNMVDGGHLTDLGNNLSSSVTFPPWGSMNASDAKLGQLGMWGGATETIPVLAGSRAINAVTMGYTLTDQRGRPRGYRTGDIGAYEVSAPFVVQGKIEPGVEFGEVSLMASGEAVEVDEATGSFTGFFSNAGVLKPVLDGVVFLPSEVELELGVEIFGASFKGYSVNEVAIEDVAEGKLVVTFATETAGDYSLLTSENLIGWSLVEEETVAENGLFRTEITPGTGPQFFRVSRE